MEELEGHVLIERVLIVNISAKYSSFSPPFQNRNRSSICREGKEVDIERTKENTSFFFPTARRFLFFRLRPPPPRSKNLQIPIAVGTPQTFPFPKRSAYGSEDLDLDCPSEESKKRGKGGWRESENTS